MQALQINYKIGVMFEINHSECKYYAKIYYLCAPVNREEVKHGNINRQQQTKIKTTITKK